MKKLLAALAFLAASSLTASTTHAGLISGFESLNGWQYMGDVSIQTSAVGLIPTQAQHMAFISTLCTGGCNVIFSEQPYSEVSSPDASGARQFLGLPSEVFDFLNLMPPTSEAPAGESGAMKTLFYVPQAGVLSFDWNKIGWDNDMAYFSIWSDTNNTNRINDWIYNSDSILPSLRSGVELECRSGYFPTPDCIGLTVETG